MKPDRLLNRNFVLLFQGQFVSQLGMAVYSIAVMLWLKHETNSATIVGLFSMIAILPGLILGPFGGSVADRYSRKKLIVIADLITGTSVIITAAVMYFSDNTSLIIGVLLVNSIVYGVVGAVFKPAIIGLLPEIISAKKMHAANGLLQSSFQIASVVGQLLGGVAYRFLGAPMVILIDGLTYLFSAFTESFIKTAKPETDDSNIDKPSLIEDTVVGLKYVWASEGLIGVFVVMSLVNFFFAPILTLLPFYVEDFLHLESDWYGYFLACNTFGMIFGSILGGVVRVPPQFRAIYVLSIIMSAGITIALLGFTSGVYSALLMFLFGLLLGCINVMFISALQLSIPNEFRGRVFGVLMSISGSLIPIAMLLGGIAADYTDKNIALIYQVCGIAVIPVCLLLIWNKPFKAFMQGPDSD